MQIWDISDAAHPTLKTAYVCPASQSDVSVYKNLMFVSAEAPTARIDCGPAGVKDTVSEDRLRGLRIVDISASPTRERSRPSRPAVARTRTRWWSIRRITITSTSTYRVPRSCGRQTSWPAA